MYTLYRGLTPRERVRYIMAEAYRNSGFITELDCGLVNDDSIWVLKSPLIYYSRELRGVIVVPAEFQMDFASVPRLPIVYTLYGNRAHREGVLHDYLYRRDCVPSVTYAQANYLFLEAMESRGKSKGVRYPMYWAVCAAGWTAWHKHNVKDKLSE